MWKFKEKGCDDGFHQYETVHKVAYNPNPENLNERKRGGVWMKQTITVFVIIFTAVWDKLSFEHD